MNLSVGSPLVTICIFVASTPLTDRRCTDYLPRNRQTWPD
jgi:hypothetical protein